MNDRTTPLACIVPIYAAPSDEYLDSLADDGIQLIVDAARAAAFDSAWIDGRGEVPALPTDRRVLASIIDAELLAGKFGKDSVAVWAESENAARFATDRGFVVVTPSNVDVPGVLVNRADEIFTSDSAVHADALSDELRGFVRANVGLNDAKHGEASMSRSNTRPDVVDGNEAIAIVGIGAIMPDAANGPEFWRNIVEGHYAISDVPIERWDPSLYFSPDRSAEDKTYSKIGGWVKDFKFDRKAFRLPPTVVQKTDPTQLICLEAVRQALADSGYDEKDFDRERCAVVLGNALGGDLRDQTNLRIQYPQIERELRKNLMEIALGKLSETEIDDALERAGAAVRQSIVGITEDSMPGELANVIAGRVAQAFDLRGPNYVVDAACASSLAAVESAVRGLRSGQYDMAISGGVDRTMGATSYVKFSKIGALSADGSRPFDANANGFVMGEGAGVFVLKRLSDAIEANDHIYALIRGVGGSSDGRGKGITAPNPIGQELAVRRAYQDAGFGPASVSLVEAHGTSTPVGDPTEFASLRTVFAEDDGPRASDYVGLGSVKSMIGHLKSAAAAASIIKVAYALRDGILPPTINVETPNPELELDKTPFELQTEKADWVTIDDAPRRAGISAFGFGGTNFHVAMEEYLPGGPRFTGRGFDTSSKPQVSDAPTLMNKPVKDGILAFAADSYDELKARFDSFAEEVVSKGVLAAAPHAVTFEGAPETGPFRLAIVFTNKSELETRVEKAQRGLERRKGWRVLSNQGVFYGEGRVPGKTAMLFPGQGSQYLGMLADLRDRFPVVQATFDEADAIMRPVLQKNLSDLIFPPAGVDESDAFLALSQTEVTQPAVLTVDVALFRLFRKLGIEPDVVAGHSLGEYGACVAAGVMPFEDALLTVAARGTEMSKATPMNGDPGLMAGVPASVEVVQEVLSQVDGYVVCANKNCKSQTIIAGLTDAVEKAIELFEARELPCVLLPVSHAFHSKVVAAASEPLRRHLEGVAISVPSIPILTNVTGGLYPSQQGCEDEIRDLLARQVAAPVEFISMIDTMHERLGAKVFVEVGPKRAQTAFVSDILDSHEDVVSLYTNHPKKGDIGSLYEALAQLWSVGTWSNEMVDELKEESSVDVDAVVEVAPAAKSARIEGTSREAVLEHMLGVLCDKTGYDPDEIETDFELEADLGIDTVKQAEIMAAVREHYGFERDEEFRLAEYPSLDRLADYVIEKLPADSESAASQPAAAPSELSAATSVDRAEILDHMLGVLCEKTGYDPDEIETDFELEADLGIDTVKQAEIMAAVREHYGFDRDDEFRLAEYPSLDRLADYVIEKMPQAGVAAASTASPTTSPTSPASTDRVSTPTTVDRGEILDHMLAVLCEKTGYDPDEIETDFELEADLGIDTVKQAEIMAAVRENYGFERDDEFRLAEYPSLDGLADYVIEKLGSSDNARETQPVQPAPASTAPAASVDKVSMETKKPATTAHLEAIQTVTNMDASASESRRFELDLDGEERPFVRHEQAADTVISGCSLGLPGTGDIFDEDVLDRLLNGENMIGQLPHELKQHIVDKRIVRLVKHKDGGGEMMEVEHTDEAIKLAGRAGRFDLDEFDVPERLQQALDETSQLAFAAGFMALRDAGLPLLPRYRETSSGKKVTIGWTLPESVGRETGVIFASAFAGQDALIDEVQASFSDDYMFNHRYLLRILGIANSRFAEFVGARGPNTKINNACASTTTAIAMAEDWIRLGRCKRVIILGADNASGDTLLEWIGSGFLATGAASTESNVEDAALPFDRRRDGMIIGMGAVGLIVEKDGLPEARGIEPIADIMGTTFVNSALHPTRLDVEHISDEVDTLVGKVEERFALDRSDIAKKTVFVSHETYTPARGGSAAAEITSIRKAFGDDADQVVIANTKGFTGHAMGAGLEDALAARALQFRALPHIANFKEADPDLGDLRLSQGGEYDLDYALRLAAGFGSQLSLALFRYRSRRANRLFSPARYRAWMRDVSDFDNPEISVENRVLRMREGNPDTERPTRKPAAAEQPRENTPEFRRDAVVVEAHTAATFELSQIRERFEDARVLVAAGPMLVTELVTRALERCGARVTVISAGRSVLEGGEVCNFDDVDILSQTLESFGPLDGVVNLLGFGRDATSTTAVEQAARHTFTLAKAWTQCGEGLEPFENHFWISVTGMGGRLGFDCVTGPLPTCGAVAGMTKSLAREWPKATVRVVDVPREGFYPDLGLQILAQAVDGAGPIEVGIIGGVRWVPTFMSTADTLSPTAASIAPQDATWLVTGGAKGITAEIVVDLASRFSGKYVLAGRTRLDYSDASEIDLEAEEARVRKELEAKGTRVTPMAVKRGLSKFQSQLEILENIERIRKAGATDVRYVSADLTREKDVRDLVEAARSEFGSIDAVIHGAGVEISRPLRDKDLDEFELVFHSKALGGLYLWDAVRSDNPSLFVTFSSVAGRFGNIAQADYSAANEVLNKLAAQINASKLDTRSISIDWTAWDDVGMAVEGSMKTILEARGVEMLPVDVGAPILGDLLESGFFGEALVAGNLGDFSDDEPAKRMVETPLGALGGRIVEKTANRVVLQREFNLEIDRFLADHVYEGTALVPGVMGYEFMTAAATALLGNRPDTLSDVSFERALKLHHDEPALVRAIAEKTKNGVELRVETTRESKTGRVIETTHFTARVDERSAWNEFTIPVEDLLEGPQRGAIYERYFHTGVFQVLDKVPYIAPEHVVAYGRVPSGVLTRGADHRSFSSAPMIREMAFQAAGLWGMYHNRRSYLPASIERSTTFVSDLEPGEEVCLRVAKRHDAKEMHIAFDVEALDSRGRRVMTLENVQLIGHRALADDESFGTFDDHRMTWLRLNGPEAQALLADRGLELDALLDDEESEAFHRLISERRQTEWSAARVAARELVARWMRDFAGIEIELADISVKKNDDGAPRPHWRRDSAPPIALPNLTITHSGGVAIAAITPGDAQIGVDLEAIEPREESFVRQYFGDSELELAPQWPRETRLAALWCAKEAVSKALGLGLQLQTREIPVLDLIERGNGWDAIIELNGEAREALIAQHGEEPVDVRIHVDTKFAFASARFTIGSARATVELNAPVEEKVPPSGTNRLTDHQRAAIAALLKHKGLLHDDHLNAGRSVRRGEN